MIEILVVILKESMLKSVKTYFQSATDQAENHSDTQTISIKKTSDTLIRMID